MFLCETYSRGPLATAEGFSAYDLVPDVARLRAFLADHARIAARVLADPLGSICGAARVGQPRSRASGTIFMPLPGCEMIRNINCSAIGAFLQGISLTVIHASML